jgi:hypothetical protein
MAMILNAMATPALRKAHGVTLLAEIPAADDGRIEAPHASVTGPLAAIAATAIAKTVLDNADVATNTRVADATGSSPAIEIVTTTVLCDRRHGEYD